MIAYQSFCVYKPHLKCKIYIYTRHLDRTIADPDRTWDHPLKCLTSEDIPQEFVPNILYTFPLPTCDLSVYANHIPSLQKHVLCDETFIIIVDEIGLGLFFIFTPHTHTHNI